MGSTYRNLYKWILQDYYVTKAVGGSFYWNHGNRITRPLKFHWDEDEFVMKYYNDGKDED
jgi:hypothetical protein